MSAHSCLTDLIEIVYPDAYEESTEDIFASAPDILFKGDDARNQWGDRGNMIVYHNRRYGDLSLMTADPEEENDRKLFSHYLWNAGILMAERVSGQRLLSDQERDQWSLQGRNVLELGAGVGLAGISSVLAGAEEVVISDYPATIVLANIKHNIEKNIPSRLRHQVKVEGHEWGALDSDFARGHKAYFNRVLAADCFWMPWQHYNLVLSMLHFLSTDPEARILAIGGFHTGRAKLAAFFDVADEEGLEVEEIYEEDEDGVRREWAREKDGGAENVTERKRWLVISRLRRKSTTKE